MGLPLWRRSSVRRTGIAAPGLGAITAMYDPRQLQIGVKPLW